MDDKPRTPRHRSEGGYARGDETRRRIIDAAIRLFGERGFEGASTREIARAAGVNAPALQYYFEGKEGVYRACAQHIAESAAAHFGPALRHAQTLLDDPDTPQAALAEAFDVFLDALADHLLVAEDAQHRRLFMAHEQVGHGPSVLFEQMNQILRPHLGQIGAQLVARLTGLPERDPLTAIRVMTLIGQVMVFHTNQRSFVTKMGWERLGEEHVALIKSTVRAQSRVLMASWRTDAPGSSASPSVSGPA